jgi:hypothetical protein
MVTLHSVPKLLFLNSQHHENTVGRERNECEGEHECHRPTSRECQHISRMFFPDRFTSYLVRATSSRITELRVEDTRKHARRIEFLDQDEELGSHARVGHGIVSDEGLYCLPIAVTWCRSAIRNT